MIDSVYIDTSCLMKVLVTEPESDQIEAIIADQDQVIVSSLTELELRNRLLALRRGGVIRERHHRALTKEVERLLKVSPFQVETLAGTVFDLAIKQIERRGAVYCRSLDRLHLAAMQALGLKSILTTDARQVAAAKSS